MKILIAYDGSAYASAAIEDLHCAGLPHQTEATIVSVAHGGWPDAKQSPLQEGQFGNPWKATLKEAEVMANDARARVQADFPGWSVSSEALFGDPAKILLKTIDIAAPDLVVVGSHGRSAASRFVLGSVSTELVHHARCSVRVVRHALKTQNPIRVLIAVDGSVEAEACVDAVARRLWPSGTEARVISVAQPLVPRVPEMVPALEGQTFATERAYQVIAESDQRERVELGFVADAAAERLRSAGLSADNVVLEGDPKHEINAEADRWKADCVFVGARGLGALDRLLLGSVSSAVVAHAHCTVEVIRR